ncbi:MAG: NAD(P)H-dependent oxidoreductase [Flavobacterium sp.]|nr:NAD(P)H-dependent oxidoreductase [Flavobacterium sp.]
MKHISIISSSVRSDRKSHNVALYFEQFLTENKLATTEILDLKAYDFPLFDERLSNQENPGKNAIDFQKKIVNSDGIIIVTPEYNGSFPASLKNAIDLLYIEWKNKPIAISTVSSGVFGGTQCLIALQFVLFKIGARTISSVFHVAKVQENYDDDGKAINKIIADKMATTFVKELIENIKENKNNL